MYHPRHSGESRRFSGRNVHPEGWWATRPLRAPFVLRTFPPRSGGNPTSHPRAYPARCARAPFVPRKGQTFAFHTAMTFLVQPRRGDLLWSPTVPFRPAKGDAGAKRTQGYARGGRGAGLRTR